MKRAHVPHNRKSWRAKLSADALQPRPVTSLLLSGLAALLTTAPCAAGAQGRQMPPNSQNMQRPPQMQRSPQQMTTSMVTSSGISADSAPWHLDWNGAAGTLTRQALGTQTELRLPLTFLHTETGPKGHSKYLAWFLARDNDNYIIAWCYLNDSGRDFFCWLYEYPTNQLTTPRFKGDYRFIPPAEPVAPKALTAASYAASPTYTGPDFKYRDWSRGSGKLDQLFLLPARANLAGLTANDADSKPAGAPVSLPSVSLTSLRVVPLHEIHVPSGNGWQEGGWRELHSMAYDQANNPYYLIQYSNVSRGYVVDLKNAKIYTTDFGQKVAFTEDPTGFGPKEDVIAGLGDVRIRRYARMEIPFTSTAKNTNAYTDVQMLLDFKAPDGKITRVPGFWDGGQTWRVRFTPRQIGNWSWRSYSTDNELNVQAGNFTCIADDTGSKGFVAVNAGLTDRHAFSYTNGAFYLPVYLREPAAFIAAPPAPPTAPTRAPLSAPRAGTVKTASLQTVQNANSAPRPADTPTATSPTALIEGSGAMPATYQDFTRRVDQATTLGFNRFWGGYLLDPVQFAARTQANEGGEPFVNGDADTLNPAYFQWMDQRIAYCNERGVVPDIGLTDLNASFASSLTDAQLSRLWRYALARYGSFDVCWNLFGASGEQSYPDTRAGLVADLARQTHLYDPIGHPLTTVVPNTQPIAVAKPQKTPGSQPQSSAPPVIFRPDNPAAASSGAFPFIPQAGAGDAQTVPNPAPQDDGQGGGRQRGNRQQGGSRQSSAAPQRNTPQGSAPQSNRQSGGRQQASGSQDSSAQGSNAQGNNAQGSSGARPGTFALPSGGDAPGGLFAPPSGMGAMTDRSAMGGGNNRGGRRRGSRTTMPAADRATPVSSSDYVTFVDPKVAAEVRAEKKALHPVVTFTMQPDVLYARASWLDVVTLLGGDPATLETDYNLNKPLVLLDTTAAAPTDQVRHRIWETIMRGGYWADAADLTQSAAQSLDDPVTRWQSACASLFHKTQFSRLLPHQDMLGALQENPFDKRRRRRAQAEAAAAKQAAQQDNGDDADPDAPPAPAISLGDPGYDETKNQQPGSIFVLADPGWEYVIYFERGGTATLDLLEATGNLRQSWYNPRTGKYASQDTILGGMYKSFNAPDNNDWVLYLSRH